MLRHWRVALGQGMTEYAIIVALIAVSGITVFSYFGGVQRSQVAAITQELAGQESGDMLELAGSYASRAGNAARRDSGLGDYYSGSSGDGSGSGSGGGSGGDGGDIGGGWTPPGGGGGWTPPGWGIEPPGGGMCPATAEQKASGTLYVWAVQSEADDCAEPEPLVKAVYLSDDLNFIKAAVESFGVLQMFDSYFPDGKTISFKVDNTIPGSMRVEATDPDTILVNLDMLTGADNELESKHLASIVGHEIVHVYDINHRKKLYPRLPIDNQFMWQSEINATTWQINHFAKLGIVSKKLFDSDYQFRSAVEQYRMKAMHCSRTPTAGDCL